MSETVKLLISSFMFLDSIFLYQERQDIGFLPPLTFYKLHTKRIQNPAVQMYRHMLHQQTLLLRVSFADRHELAPHILRYSAAFIAQVIEPSAQIYALESEIITPWNKIVWLLLNTEKFLAFHKRLNQRMLVQA